MRSVRRAPPLALYVHTRNLLISALLLLLLLLLLLRRLTQASPSPRLPPPSPPSLSQGVAAKLKSAGYKTAAFGKWDAGMATPDHTPHGRGYDIALNYFHHCNDYWSFTDGERCNRPAPKPAGGPTSCSKYGGMKHACLGNSADLDDTPRRTKTSGDCCALCSSTAGCAGWAWGKTEHPQTGEWACHLKKEVRGKTAGNCTSACQSHLPGEPFSCAGVAVSVVDLWQKIDQGKEGPAHGMNSSCVTGNPNGAHPDDCVPGPLDDKWYDGYEDSLFEQHVMATIEGHDAATPLFVFWAPHIVHTPLQVPQPFIDKFGFIADTDKPTHNRQLYHAMVNFADGALGNITDTYKRKGMYDDLLIVFSTDNVSF